jgi:hypothetical protein
VKYGKEESSGRLMTKLIMLIEKKLIIQVKKKKSVLFLSNHQMELLITIDRQMRSFHLICRNMIFLERRQLEQIRFRPPKFPGEEATVMVLSQSLEQLFVGKHS